MTKKLRIAITAGVPLLLAAAYLLHEPLIAAVRRLPPCWIYESTGIYCPGCGNTRSATALLHFDLPLALRNNVTMPFFALLLVLAYVEIAAGLFGKQIRLLPRSGLFWGIVIGAFCAYFVVRNFVPAIAPVS